MRGGRRENSRTRSSGLLTCARRVARASASPMSNQRTKTASGLGHSGWFAPRSTVSHLACLVSPHSVLEPLRTPRLPTWEYKHCCKAAQSLAVSLLGRKARANEVQTHEQDYPKIASISSSSPPSRFFTFFFFFSGTPSPATVLLLEAGTSLSEAVRGGFELERGGSSEGTGHVGRAVKSVSLLPAGSSGRYVVAFVVDGFLGAGADACAGCAGGRDPSFRIPPFPFELPPGRRPKSGSVLVGGICGTALRELTPVDGTESTRSDCNVALEDLTDDPLEGTAAFAFGRRTTEPMSSAGSNGTSSACRDAALGPAGVADGAADFVGRKRRSGRGKRFTAPSTAPKSYEGTSQ